MFDENTWILAESDVFFSTSTCSTDQYARNLHGVGIRMGREMV